MSERIDLSKIPIRVNPLQIPILCELQEPTSQTLDNGLQVVLSPQSQLHSLVFGLYVRVGPRYEQAQQQGITHFLEHVLFRGNACYPTSLEMNCIFESWGGSLNAYTTREYTYFYGRLHPSYLRESLSFLSEMVRTPLFADIDLERNIILEERLQDVDSDGQLLDENDVSRHTFWGEHPLGYPIIGHPKIIRRLRKEELEQHFYKHFVAKNMVLCLTGNFHSDEAIDYIAKYFSDLPSGTRIISSPLPEKLGPLKPTAFVHHDSSQVSVMFSFRGPSPRDPDYLKLMLIDRILDDGMSSRLWQRIVEGRGLCYDLWTSLDTYSDISIFDLGASVAPEKLTELVEGLYHEILLMRDQGISQAELEHTRRRWRFHQECMRDQVGALNEHIGTHILHETYIPFNQQIEQLNNISTAQLQDFTNRLFRPEHHLLTAIGPLSKSRKRILSEFAAQLGT